MTKQNEQQINFTVHNIYVKDISFESPNAPAIFNEEWKPKLDFDIQMGRASLEDNLYEVTITLSIKVIVGDQDSKQSDNKDIAFLVEVKQAGVFLLEGKIEQEQIDYILSTTAPTILFPYVREAISNLVTRGGFPQLVIPPMNFEAMYQEHLEKQASAHTEMATA